MGANGKPHTKVRCDKGIPGKPHFWTKDLMEHLHEMAERGYNDHEIAATIGKSLKDLQKARSKHGYTGIRALRHNHSIEGTARRLGVTPPRVHRWIEYGWLKSYARPAVNNKVYQFITDEHLFAFLEDERYWLKWKSEDIPDKALRDWTLELRAATPMLTVEQVADRLGVTLICVQRYIREGLLPAVGPLYSRLVRASDLANFIPPYARTRGGWKHRTWQPHELHRLQLWRRRGWTYTEIGREMGRGNSSIHKKLQDLRNARKIGAAWYLRSSRKGRHVRLHRASVASERSPADYAQRESE